MNKFTIFSIILAISVITITADLAVRDYFASQGLASLLGSATSEEISPVIGDEEPKDETRDERRNDERRETREDAEINEPLAPKPEVPPPVILAPPSPTVTQVMAASAGFSGTLNEKHFEGKIYQLLDITQFPVEFIGFYQITQENIPAATIVEITLKDEIRALQLYSLLQNKTKPYIDLTLNETNAYGDRSFYINHAKKKEEAFLTVKIRNRLYAFAYVKFYHPEIKKLIELMTQ